MIENRCIVRIVLDNLRIGGIQRLALDEAYSLSDRGYLVQLIVLSTNKEFKNDSILNNDKNLVIEKKIDICYLGERKQQFNELKKLLKSDSQSRILYICHTLRGTMLLRMASVLYLKKILINTTIHQLPSLSSPAQRFKRFFYAQFTNNLYAYSLAVKMDWDKRMRVLKILTLNKGVKRITVNRNGVYLPRLKGNVDLKNENIGIKRNRRLIFVGRQIAWKGLDTFFDLLDQPLMTENEALIMIPDNPNVTLKERLKDKRYTCLVGKSLSNIVLKPHDLHVYPTNYGVGAKFNESISLNVLEMSAYGIISFVTSGGCQTWPELCELGIVKEVDWNNLEIVSKDVLEETNPLSADKKFAARELVSIENHIAIFITQLNS